MVCICMINVYIGTDLIIVFSPKTLIKELLCKHRHHGAAAKGDALLKREPLKLDDGGQ